MLVPRLTSVIATVATKEVAALIRVTRSLYRISPLVPEPTAGVVIVTVRAVPPFTVMLNT
ncbi:hypothetical protein D3C81_2293800 [compost metagenome]